MTDFLARLAERAVGEEEPMARPRLPARFEDAALPDTAFEVAIVEDEVAEDEFATEADRPIDRPEPVDAPHPSGTPPASGDRPVEPPRPVPSSDPERDHEPTRPQAPRRRHETVVRAAPDPSTRKTPDVTSDRYHAVAVQASPPSRPAPTVVPAAPSPRSESTPPLEDDAPTVRIHIGRLEVRANLVDPVPPPRAHDHDTAREAARLSLSDYLRGER